MKHPGTERVRCWGRWLRRRVPAGDRGTAAVELAIVTPVVIVMLLVVVALGRFSHGRLLVEQASAAAARSASLTSSPFQASAAARQTAAATLAGSGLSCAGVQVSVDSGSFHAGGQVAVTVTCTADLSDLALPGVPGSKTLSATSRSPLETYRQFSPGFSSSGGAGNRVAGDRP
jgi:Flp pilus assembly protein TadG